MNKRFTYSFLTLLSFLACLCATAAPRYERSINDKWTFHKEGQTLCETVSIPHTWNAEDCRDDEPGYWRGIGWYEKTITINDQLDGSKVYARFEGAGQEVDLFVNGKHAGNHKGGYTAFVFDISELLQNGQNDFRIKVDNSHNEGIPPMSADFTFFGGIYRDVSLVFVPKNHISVEHFASDGIYISTPEVTEAFACVTLETHLSIGQAEKALTLEHKVFAPDGAQVAVFRKRIRKPAQNPDLTLLNEIKIDHPVLWDVDSPQLYYVQTSIFDAKGNVIDSQRNSFGIRYFHFDADKGFSLNGRPLKLMGTNRHQDYRNIGNALPDEMHLRDVRLLIEMGGNFLRIAHYPQDPLVYSECDRLGILSSVEIPIVNNIGSAPDFTANCVTMAKEMVYQAFNHPSMIIWAYMNEVLIHSPWKDGTITKEGYFQKLCDCASDIESAIKKADPLRPTLIPCHNYPERYKESGITEIPDMLGFNLYNGWYSGELESFGPTLDKLHGMFPGKPLFLTEYGADADSRLHSFQPECFDYTCDYALKYHQHYIPVILEKEYLAGSTVWNINDFYSEGRSFAVPHVNCKGLTTLDRTPKDSYWLYKALLDKKPFIRIGGSDWKIRGGQSSEGVFIQPVEVFATAPKVELTLNGKTLGTKPVNLGSALFDVPFTNGENILEAKGSDGATDLQRVDFRLVPEDMSEFKEISVMLGSKRYFEDRAGSQIWIPEQEYRPGSWGYVGGEIMRQRRSAGPRPAFEADIAGTDQDPIFQTQRAGLESFKADVPDGKYYVYLYFAELTGPYRGKPMPYNLGNDALTGGDVDRIFDVSINGVSVLKDFNIKEEYGYNTAVIQRFAVDVNGGSGISVNFTPVRGLSILNAIRILRVDDTVNTVDGPVCFDDNLVCIISDMHIRPNKYQQWHFERTVNEILQLNPRPRNVICLGDIAYLTGKPEEYAAAKVILSRLEEAGMTLTMTVGNHDRRDAFAAAFPEKAAASELAHRFVYTVTTPRADFLLLDSLIESEDQEAWITPGEIDDAQKEWLAEKLKAYTDKPVFVMAHHPMGEVKLQKILYECPSCCGYIYGHEHMWITDWAHNRYKGLYILRTLSVPSTGHWGDIGYTLLQLEEDKAIATYCQWGFFFPRPLKDGETRPALWDEIERDHRNAICVFPYSTAAQAYKK
ncbi:MAG: metallophosphoesterase [Bacteroidales bacterium]|nr:metallophosphoesterase [Bacteroidales bacterium]